MNEKCENCRFKADIWPSPKDPDGREGVRCRRYPRVPFYGTRGALWKQPFQYKTDWCGEWKEQAI